MYVYNTEWQYCTGTLASPPIKTLVHRFTSMSYTAVQDWPYNIPSHSAADEISPGKNYVRTLVGFSIFMHFLAKFFFLLVRFQQ